MKIEIERGDEIGRGDEDTQNEAKKERGDEIERKRQNRRRLSNSFLLVSTKSKIKI